MECETGKYMKKDELEQREMRKIEGEKIQKDKEVEDIL